MINLNSVQLIVFEKSAKAEEILQNVNVILTTPEGSVPYDRNFGMDVELVDMPINEAKSLYVVEAITKVRKYEPRAVVDRVDFEGDAEGELIPKVVLRIETE